jgi:hypothetical protein
MSHSKVQSVIGTTSQHADFRFHLQPWVLKPYSQQALYARKNNNDELRIAWLQTTGRLFGIDPLRHFDAMPTMRQR